MKVVITGCDHIFEPEQRIAKEEVCELEIYTFCPMENLILWPGVNRCLN